MAQQSVSAALRDAAERDEPAAMVQLGICYRDGLGAPPDASQAAQWFMRAAKKGDAVAMRSLGSCFAKGAGVRRDAVQAAAWYRRAAEKGDADAMFNLGLCFEKGQGVPPSDAEAVRWYQRAAAAGETLAMNNLGLCYETGKGVAQDCSAAVQWFRRAAGKGEALAMNNLGVCYEKGRGVAQDRQKALSWYRKAAQHGSANAMARLGACYDEGFGVPKDDTKAVAWYRRAAEKGHADAMFNLGLCFKEGKGVPKNPAQAREWYNLAIEASDSTDAGDANELQLLFQNAQRLARSVSQIALQTSVDAGAGQQQRNQPKASKQPGEEEEAEEEEEEEMLAWFRPPTKPGPDPAERKRLDAEQRERERAVEEEQRERERAAAEEQRALEQRQHRATVADSLKPQLPDERRCGRCSQLYQLGTAVLMPACLHAMCRPCVMQDVTAQLHVKCPTCAMEQPLYGDPASFDVHPFVEENLLSCGASTRCGQCDAETPDDEALVTWECATCETAFCEVHAAIHRTKAASRRHPLTPRAVKGALPVACPLHSRPLEAYCHSCQLPICLSCLWSTHPANTANHRTQLLDAGLIEQLRTQIGDAVEQGHQMQLSNLDHIIAARLAAEETRAHIAKTRQAISAVFADLRQVLSEQKAALLERLDLAQAVRQSSIEQTAMAYTSRWVLTSSTVAVAQQLAAPTTDALVLAHFQHTAVDGLCRLVSERLTEDVPAPLQTEFLVNARLAELVDHAGQFAAE